MMNTVKELHYGNTRCYCINGTLLVDTDQAGTLSAFFRCAKEKGVEIQALRYLLLTHFHPDHMGIAGELAELGIKIVAFEEQRAFIHASDGIFARDKRVHFTPIKDEEVLFLSCGESREFLSAIGIYGEVIPTPGHSDDSVSLVLDDGTALVGDLYPWHTVPAYNDRTLEASWQKLRALGVQCVKYGHFKEEKLE